MTQNDKLILSENGSLIFSISVVLNISQARTPMRLCFIKKKTFHCMPVIGHEITAKILYCQVEEYLGAALPIWMKISGKWMNCDGNGHPEPKMSNDILSKPLTYHRRRSLVVVCIARLRYPWSVNLL